MSSLMKMQKIHLCHIFATFSQGGPQVRMCQVINALPRRFSHSIIAIDDKTTARHLLKENVEVQYVSSEHRRNHPLYPLYLALRLRRLKPDMVLTYNWGAIEGVVASKIAGVRHTIHGEYGFGPEEAQVQKRRRILARRILLRYVDAIIAPSSVLVSVFEDIWKIPQEKVAYIANGVDCDFYSPGSGHEERERLGIASTDFVIGTVSHLSRIKNINYLIEVVSRMVSEWPIHFLILGDGSEKEALLGLVREKAIEKRVHFLGHCPKPVRYYKAMDIFALSSLSEQMPVSVLEAMATGLPVVSTRVGDVEKMVSLENVPFITKLDDRELYEEAIKNLLANKAARKTIGASNRKKCLAEYDVKKMIHGYHALYSKVLGSGVEFTT